MPRQSETNSNAPDTTRRMLAGGGEMGALTLAFDWSKTPVGPLESWPHSLRTCVSLVLRNRFPMFLWWGEELIQFYNDGYRPSLGSDRHPRALGMRGREFWTDIWPVIGPLIERVQAGESTWAEDQLIPIVRDGSLQEVYWTFSYAPVPDDAGDVGGVLVTCQETTEQVQGERQLRLLRDLAASSSEAKSVRGFCDSAARVLEGNDADLPFALLYLADEHEAKLVSTVRLDEAPAGTAPKTIDLHAPHAVWPLRRALEGRFVVSDLQRRLGDLPGGAWPEPPESAVILPLRRSGQTEPVGFLISGVSSRRALDDRYWSLFSLVADQIATGIVGVESYEAERERAQSLAELDRAKTVFFSNVSHELRTPLSLMLGPLDDTLEHGAALSHENRERLEMVRRNALQLLKLVNTLLEFARIEAGRSDARYAATDLSTLTSDLASLFRSAVERAGLRLAIDCPELGEDVYVDRAMWEKIVFNLISNALKYTFDGEIRVALRRDANRVTLQVHDTGRGIPKKELPHLFERFRRVEGARGRSNEGSGIGLALVWELARLHGGEVRVESALEEGSTFEVSLPLGRDHLPADRVTEARSLDSSSIGREAHDDGLRGRISEATLSALSPSSPVQKSSPKPAPSAERVLLVDDNRDMLDYLERLLSDRYDVDTVTDGRAALEAARRHPPDLVVTDVMMPDLDGFELLHELRADTQLSSVPVIMLSARAGEEARIGAIGAGADDYIVKPFTARELMTRISARIELSRLERQLRLERAGLERLFAQTPIPTAVLAGPRLVFEMANPAYLEVVGERDLVGKPMLEALPELEGQGLDEILRAVMSTGEAHVAREMRVQLDRTGSGESEETFWTYIYAPLKSPTEEVGRVIVIANDVTEQIRARTVVQQSEARYRHIFEGAGVSIWQEDFSGVEAILDELAQEGVSDLHRHLAKHPELVIRAMDAIQIVDVNEATLRLFGANSKAELLANLERVRAADSHAAFTEELVAFAEGKPFLELETRLRRMNGEPLHAVATISFPRTDGEGRNVLVTLTDISDRKRAEESLKEADTRKNDFLAMLGHELRNPLAAVRSATELVKHSTSGNERLERAARTLDRQVAHATRLVDGLLEVSRITRGKIELQRSSIDLRLVIEQVLENHAEALEKKELRLKLSLPATPLWIWGDEVRLVQVFDNLVTNSIKFTPAGGSIELSAETKAERAVISIRDSGSGFNPGLRSRLFEPFRQEAKDIARVGGGLGIGLALVKSLVTLHGGSVSGSSDGPGTGAEFQVELPLNAREADGKQPALASRAASPRRILVVEDNHDAAEMLRDLLELGGHQVTVAANGVEGLEALHSESVDVVLCDLGLPEMSGYEMARTVRADAALRQTTLVALTGYGQPEDRARTEEAGFDAHLTKPVEMSRLNAVLSQLGRESQR